MRNIFNITIQLSICCFLLNACVPANLFSEVEKEKDLCKSEREELYTENENLTVENTELKAKLELAEDAGIRTEEQCIENIEELKTLKNRYAHYF